MANKSCCFEGNLSYNNLEKITAKLKKIKNGIKKFGVTEFYVGAESDFDRLCLDCLQEIKSENPNIKLCLILAESPSKSKLDENFFKKFDEVTHLNFEKISKQFVKLSTFNWFIDNSDYLISVAKNRDNQRMELSVRDLMEKDLLFFNTRLKMLRIKNGLSQINLAEIEKISPSAIGMYEHGRCEPNFLTFLKICIALNTTPNYVLGSDKRFQSKVIEIDELVQKFSTTIRKSRGLLCDGELMDRATRENFVVALATAFEITKRIIKKRKNVNKC